MEINLRPNEWTELRKTLVDGLCLGEEFEESETLCVVHAFVSFLVQVSDEDFFLEPI